MRQKRRDFIKNSSLIAAGTWLVPYFLQAQGPVKGSFQGKRLIVIQLSGGNDGLNTIVPYENDLYYQARPQLSIKKGDVLKVSDQLGLNPALESLRPLFDDGLISVVNGVGYPNPDRSHFRSMDIWHTASNSNEYWQTGWLGRYLDQESSDCDSLHKAIELNNSLDLAMKGRHVKGLAMSNPGQMIRDINTGYNRTLAEMAAHHQHEHESVGYLYKTLVESVNSADYLKEHLSLKRESKGSNPQSQFSNHLKTVVQMINSGMDTSVYYTQLGGFDTHAGQQNRQRRLLKVYAEGVKYLVDDLKASGQLSNTLILTFSEFGRRVAQNASQGTDHGTANNLFLIGENVKAGFYNDIPSLSDLDNGDLKYSVDFRNIYATILDNWLGVNSKEILKRDFSPLDLLKV